MIGIRKWLNSISLALITLAAFLIQCVIITSAFPLYGIKSLVTSKLPILYLKQDDEECELNKLRFGGVGQLYSNEKESATEKLKRLSESTVAVIGIGGVGSWTAESLCRSGVGNLILIDLDDICISNSNRQLHATSGNVGKMKVEVMEDRLLDINPTVNVTSVLDFVTVENAEKMLISMLPELTCLVDAIDGKREKAAIISAAARLKIPIVTCGGAAGRIDPTKVLCDDIIRVQEDRLLFWVRKDLRKRYGFPKGPEKFSKKSYKPRKWKIWAVYSSEIQKVISKGDRTLSSSLRTCDSSLGTASFVTGTYGLVAAAKVISMIVEGKLVFPRYHGLPLLERPEQSLNKNEKGDTLSVI